MFPVHETSQGQAPLSLLPAHMRVTAVMGTSRSDSFLLPQVTEPPCLRGGGKALGTLPLCVTPTAPPLTNVYQAPRWSWLGVGPESR